MTLYIYKVIPEAWDGSRGKRTKTIERFKPNLEVGGLYVHLGRGFPEAHRVLSVETKDLPD